jgi:uncharacterized protein
VDLKVIWHHVGREHGGLEYAEDIRKNTPEVIDQYIKLKEEWIQNNETSHQFLKYDENTIIELSSETGFIILYLMDKGLQLSLNAKTKLKYPWWVIDVVDIVEIRPNVFCSKDLFIDIKVYEDGSYHVIDIDEFEEAIQLGVLTNEHISKALKSFHFALCELNEPRPPIIEKAESIRLELLNKNLLKA